MKNKILFVVSLLFGLMFINAGLNKFFNYMPMPEEMPQELLDAMTAMMSLKWLMPLVAVAEIVGGVLFIFNKTRALGAIIILPVMVGIVLFHIVTEPDELIMPFVLSAILAWVMIENKDKYTPLLK
ncbi:DoxX family protein [Wenyingzhuangia fucanilytica]|uniref:DoxX family protein n=1 Tax=Wenyingzhuangia fucanilytica TaxID=1790137 RepID=A0A1B1Y2D1_9FLAO|nr:DoxX family protein [Wenyingzhuangia fucanilytica]ANW94908.1 DoxX family protein [Wenyingzhuangia fucanilytica]